jgi:surface antigen
MTTIDAEMLVAYLDGEVDAGTAARVEQALASDPALAARLAALQRGDARLKAAFDPVLSAPLPSLALVPAPGRIAAAGVAPATRRRASWVAIAAGLAGLVVGFAAGQLGPILIAPVEPGTVAAIEAELPDVLEHEVSGTTITFHDTLQGVSGSVTPVRTFKNADGSFCRAYEARASDSDATVVSRGIACRDDDGRWLTRLQVNEA